MATRFVPDTNSNDPDIPGVDRHYYENQIGAASPFDDTYAFRLAVARAKDEARHQLIKTIKKTAEGAASDRGVLEEAKSFSSGERVTWTRSIDGMEGAPDNDIKL